MALGSTHLLGIHKKGMEAIIEGDGVIIDATFGSVHTKLESCRLEDDISYDLR